MKKYILPIVLILGIAITGYYFFKQEEVKDPVIEQQKLSALNSNTITTTFLNATTTSATSTDSADFSVSGRALITGARKVTLYFQRGDVSGTGNIGTSTFAVDVSRDGTTWFSYNKLIDNVTNANSAQLTRVSSVVLSASTNLNTATATKMYSMDLGSDVINYIRCGVSEGTDGEHSCFALIEY